MRETFIVICLYCGEIATPHRYSYHCYVCNVKYYTFDSKQKISIICLHTYYNSNFYSLEINFDKNVNEFIIRDTLSNCVFVGQVIDKITPEFFKKLLPTVLTFL